MNPDSKVRHKFKMKCAQETELVLKHYEDGAVALQPSDPNGFPLTVLSRDQQRTLIETLQGYLEYAPGMSEPKELTFASAGKVDANLLLGAVCEALTSADSYWHTESHRPEIFDVDQIPWLKNPDRWRHANRGYVFPFVKGGYLTLQEETGEEEYILDLEAITCGVEVMSSEYPGYWEALCSDESTVPNVADKFIQCCVFGEVTYE